MGEESMKVKRLIELLLQVNPDLEVFAWHDGASHAVNSVDEHDQGVDIDIAISDKWAEDY
jgi:hypothetical protein